MVLKLCLLEELHDFIFRLWDLDGPSLVSLLGSLDLVFFKDVDDLLELVLAMLDLVCGLQDTLTRLVGACVQT